MRTKPRRPTVVVAVPAQRLTDTLLVAVLPQPKEATVVVAVMQARPLVVAAMPQPKEARVVVLQSKHGVAFGLHLT